MKTILKNAIGLADGENKSDVVVVVWWKGGGGSRVARGHRHHLVVEGGHIRV